MTSPSKFSIMQFQNILDASPDLVSFLDHDYVYRYVNRTYLEYSQKSLDEIIGHSVMDLMSKQEFDEVMQPHLESCLSGETVRHANWFTYPGYGRRYMDVVYTPSHDESNNISGILISIRDITDMSKTWQRYERVFSHSLNLQCLLDYCGNFVEVSPAWETLLGWQASDLTARCVTDFLEERNQETFLEQLAMLKSGVELNHIEHRFRHQDGYYVWLAWNATHLEDESLIVVTAHDVTDYKNANDLNIDLVGQTQLVNLIDKSMLVMDSLEEIAGLVVDALAALLDCNHVMVLLDDIKAGTTRVLAESHVPFDRVGHILSYNPDTDQEKRLARGELLVFEDMDMLESFSPVQQYIYEKGVRSYICIPLVAEDTMLGITLLGRSEPGEMDWYQEKTAIDIITQLGVAIYQFQLKAKLAEEGKTLRTLIDHIPDYIFIKDREGRFRISNEAHAAAVDLAPADLIGKTAEEVFASDLAPQFHQDDLAVMASGQPLINEERLTSGIDGKLIHVLTTKVPLRGENDEITGLVGISRDITVRKYAEASRAETAQLRTELQKEKELSDLKTHFILTVSHEFRTPLTIIQTSGQLLERHYDRLDREKREKLLGRILDQTRQMTRMIDDTLLAGQSQISQIPFNPARVHVVSLSRIIFEQMQTVDQNSHQMYFDNRISEDFELMLDAGLYREILMNLLGNAIRYSPNEKPITLSIYHDSSHVVVQVEDEGIGIEPDDLPRIFDSFFRGENVGSISGTGLGLSIVQTCVELHDGNLECESEPDVGTRFILRFPIQ